MPKILIKDALSEIKLIRNTRPGKPLDKYDGNGSGTDYAHPGSEDICFAPTRQKPVLMKSQSCEDTNVIPQHQVEEIRKLIPSIRRGEIRISEAAARVGVDYTSVAKVVYIDY